MKKTYSKPELYIESFQLTQSIAERCGAVDAGDEFGKPQHLSKTSCGWLMPEFGFAVFIAQPICEVPMDEGDFGGICYNNPDGHGIFAS